jgi:acyl-CoA thioesterase YciA
MTRSLPPSDQPVIRVTAMPADANFYGDIFGGWLMGLMDLAAGSVASRRAQGRAATVAAEAMTFHHPVQIGDEVSVYAQVTAIGRTSMKIATEAWKRDRHGEEFVKVTEGRFTFVALDAAGRPRPVSLEDEISA